MSRKMGILLVACALAFGLMAGCSKSDDPTAGQSAGVADQVKDTSEPAFVLDTKPFYVLVMGLDSRDGTVESGESKSRSDTMMLVRVDPTTYQIGILSIPRDTYAWINDTDNKINEAYYLDGSEESVKQVELLTGIHADYYMSTTFGGFQKIVDGVGGVDAFVPIDMRLQDIVGGGTVELSAGEQHLDGAGALVAARVRKTYSWDGDTHRQTNSRHMVESIIKSVAGDSDAVKKYSDLIYKNCDTNMDRRAFDGYVDLFCKNAGSIDFVDGTTPYENGMDDAIGMWITYRDEETSHACATAVDNHRDPQEIVPLPMTY